MELKYRGVNYNYTPTPTVKLGTPFAMGSYRGVTHGFQLAENAPENVGVDLQWRGVPYHSGATPSVIALPPVPVMAPMTPMAPVSSCDIAPALSMGDRSRALFMSHHRRIRRREQGMMMRLAQNIGMSPESASQYESQIQGKIPHDFAGYDNSHCAMS